MYGMDISAPMLQACRQKGFAADLKKHDLTIVPYPYENASLDHAVCIGALHFFRDLGPVFREVARIIRPAGIFVFVVGDRDPAEPAEMKVEADYTQPESLVTIYRHSHQQVEDLLNDHGFELAKSLQFSVPMDPQANKVLPAQAYLTQKIQRI